MGFLLPSHLSFCIAQDRVVFLDLERDRYFRLPDAAEQCFLRLVGVPGRLDAPILSRLAMLQLVRVPGKEQPRAAASPDISGDLPSTSGSASPWSISRALVSQWRAERWVRRHPLAKIAGRLRRMAPVAGKGGACSHDIVMAHRLASRVLTAHDRCLARSIALLSDLRKAGADAQLVFGVTARPFAAHCWVQSGGLVLNSPAELARLYTPILVL
jgi:hypothetical protein